MLCYKDVDNIAYTRDNTETRDIVEVSISAVGGDALSPRNNHKRFWSSSESPSNKNGAFSVYFYNAFAQLSEKDGALYLRAVCVFLPHYTKKNNEVKGTGYSGRWMRISGW